VEAVWCPHGQSEEVVKYGTASKGKERFRGQQAGPCGRTFMRAYADPGRVPQVKRQMVEMTLKGRGVRDIARGLQISPNTVIRELKKRPRSSRRSTKSLLTEAVRRRSR
jgi:transposase-like protein